MKNRKDTLKTALTLQHQGTTLLHRINPKFFPVTTFFALVSAVTPYVTVYFSAKLLQELSLNAAQTYFLDGLWLLYFVQVFLSC